MFDAHAHLQDPRLAAHLTQILDAAEAAGVRAICSCATSPDDVAGVQALPREWKSLRITRAYGTHPWHVVGLATHWLDPIEAALAADPSACVGEVGLDGIRKEVPFELQREVLAAQLELAARLQRPVIFHGARVWGKLLEFLKPHAPRLPGLLLHNFSGSPEILREFLRLGASFSFSGSVCNPQNKSARAVASLVPLPQLMVETDSPDLGFIAGAPFNQPANLPLVIDALAQLRSVASADLCHATEENARRFFYGFQNNPSWN